MLEVLKLISSKESYIPYLSELSLGLNKIPKEKWTQTLSARFRLVDGLENEDARSLCSQLDPTESDHLFSAVPFISPFDTGEEREKSWSW